MIENINIKTDTDLKKSAEIVLKNYGYDLQSAINSFLRRCVQENRIPFEFDIPNDETIKAIKEGRKLAYKKNCETYTNEQDLKKAFGL